MLVPFRARFDSDLHDLEIVAVSRLILDYLGVSGSIWEHLGASGASGNIWETEKSHRTTPELGVWPEFAHLESENMVP